MSEKNINKIENYLVAIRALAEKSNNEYTDSILQLIRDCELILYREDGAEIIKYYTFEFKNNYLYLWRNY